MKPPKGKIFARIDYFTGEPVLDSGWIFNGGDEYAATQESADRIACEIYGYKDFQTLYDSMVDELGEDQDCAYYTEWTEDEWYEDIDVDDELDLALQNLAELLEFCNGLDEENRIPAMLDAKSQLQRHGR